MKEAPLSFFGFRDDAAMIDDAGLACWPEYSGGRVSLSRDNDSQGVLTTKGITWLSQSMNLQQPNSADPSIASRISNVT